MLSFSYVMNPLRILRNETVFAQLLASHGCSIEKTNSNLIKCTTHGIAKTSTYRCFTRYIKDHQSGECSASQYCALGTQCAAMLQKWCVSLANNESVVTRGSGNIWQELSTFTARSAVPRTAARTAHSVSVGIFWRRYISSEQESVFPVFLGGVFHDFIFRKKEVIEVQFFQNFN